MLSWHERIGLGEILRDLEDEDLFSVLETTTKRMYKTHHREEAIEKILSCTEQPSDLLKRQKITKKILFNYLIKKGKSALAEWSKAKLAKRCFDLWDSSETCVETDYMEETVVTSCDSAVSPVNSQMGIEFSKWFFKVLNTLQDFGPEHFWPNCNLAAELLTPFDQKEVALCGANDVATFLANLIMIDKYYFSPNESSDSILLEFEQHGLVKIGIRGILHQHSNCVGLFDSAFGLVKNPACEDTYKIQVIKVKLQVTSPAKEILPANNYLPICQRV